MRIISNKKYNSATLLFTASETINVVGNNSVSAICVGDEEIEGVTISQVWSGINNTEQGWTIKRGANTVLSVNGTYHFDFSGYATALTLDSTANLAITLGGSGSDATLIVEVQKRVKQ